MREIKFRAWDNLENRWYEPTFEGYRGKIEEIMLSPRGRLTMRTMTKLLDESMFPNRFDLMQYTGLHDKNGREIYEGDIVRYHMTRSFGEHYDPVTLGFIGTDWDIDADIIGKVSIWPSNGVMMTKIVTNDPDMFSKQYPVPKRWHVTQECEVIGNVFENPELLEAEK